MSKDICEKKIKQIPPYQLRSEKEIISSWKGDVDKPLVSINCITYNHAPYIEDALIGFLRQETDFPIEILVHDDASMDGTADIIRKYEALYPKLIKPIYQSENQYSKGIRPIPNNGLRAKGKYTAVCEGDDYWLTNDKLKNQVSALESNSEVYICIHAAYQLDIEKNSIEEKFSKGSRPTILSGSEAVRSLSQYAPTASYVFNTKAFKELPDWFFSASDLPFGDYFIEAILGRNGILYLPKISSVYRRNVVGSYTQRTTKADIDDLLDRMRAILFYTHKLADYSSINAIDIKIRCEHIYHDNLKMYLARKSFRGFRNTVCMAICEGFEIKKMFTLIIKSRIFFSIYWIAWSLRKSVRENCVNYFSSFR